MTTSKNDNYMKSLILIIFWHIWKTRNSNLFQKEFTSCSRSIVREALTDLCDIIQSKHAKGRYTNDKCRVFTKWKPPTQGYIKINTDGAWKATTSKGGARYIIRNEEGRCKVAASVFIRVPSALVAELMTIKNAL